jgi:hypothetical protein
MCLEYVPVQSGSLFKRHTVSVCADVWLCPAQLRVSLVLYL